MFHELPLFNSYDTFANVRCVAMLVGKWGYMLSNERSRSWVLDKQAVLSNVGIVGLFDMSNLLTYTYTRSSLWVP